MRWTLLLAVAIAPFAALTAEAEEGRFDEFEIRVIRPRFFTKSGRIEMGVDGVVVTNQTFVYTYLGAGTVTYHLSERFALEGSFTFGLSIDKEDKTFLAQDFNIKTQIARTESIMGGGLQWSPAYGKFQVGTGGLIYFDTYVSGGGAMTGIRYLYDHCPVPVDSTGKVTGSIPEQTVVQYPGIYGGVGQRFYIDQSRSLRWEIKGHAFAINSADGACVPGTTGVDLGVSNLTVQVGYSRFF